MIFSYNLPTRNQLRQTINSHYLVDENRYIPQLIEYLDLKDSDRESIKHYAIDLVTKVRNFCPVGSLDAFLKEYDLSTKEGIAVMCIAESILRIPDSKTGDVLIKDKLASVNWKEHLGKSSSLFVNASTWTFLLTGKILNKRSSDNGELHNVLSKVLSEGGKPVIRQAVQQAIKLISNHFIIGNHIQDAVTNSKEHNNCIYRYSFDMLGEAAITNDDATIYFNKYMDAIKHLHVSGDNGPIEGSGISIKLSALHPRYEYSKYKSVFDRLYPNLVGLANEAKQANISFIIDAEESDRLDIQLDLFKALCHEPSLQNWKGLGIAVQAYQKRAFTVIDWLVNLAKNTNHRLMLRLVKGAYWDTEIKQAQQLGLKNYPVFTRKESTDISYLACAKKLLINSDAVYPMFATHNAHTISAILHFAESYRDFEFQRLYGMGEQLHSLIVNSKENPLPCRVYAPCGEYKELLPYLVRRLLENGANSSFVNRILDPLIPAEDVAADPVQDLAKHKTIANSKIPLPPNLYLPHRMNAKGLNLTDEKTLLNLDKKLEKCRHKKWCATSIINGEMLQGKTCDVFSPSNNNIIGSVLWATDENVDLAIQHAQHACSLWQATTFAYRANCLFKTAELLEANVNELISLCMLEAGKTIANAVAEIREAIDYCRYYAYQANLNFTKRSQIAGSIINVEYTGQGVFACISPWNFPLAIFIGQIIAALVAGNTVVAKPAEQTSLIATRTVHLLHQAGIPTEALQLIIGNAKAGASIVEDNRIAGVVFTGSTTVAQDIRKSLSRHHQCCKSLIAETGGINAMVIDSSALLEQAVTDVIKSAFDSAGQRCSALRVVYVQQEIAKEFLSLLKGAMAELEIGDPRYLSTDIGPIIDKNAKLNLEHYVQDISKIGQLIYEVAHSPSQTDNNFFTPQAYEIESIKQIKNEVFGPILHVITYDSLNIDNVLDEINHSGYGLTFGVHSRLDSFINQIGEKVYAGNIYINRDIIGATVGIQPFGGERKSGTGPKAGGPNYLYKFIREIREIQSHSYSKATQLSISSDFYTNSNYVIEPSVNSNQSTKHEVQTINSKHISLKASVKYSNIKHINSSIQLAEKGLIELNDTKNEKKNKYLNYICENLNKNQNKIIDIYNSEFDLHDDKAYSEMLHATAVANDYKIYAQNNFKQFTLEIGPTGEQNSLGLHRRGIFMIYCDSHPLLMNLTSVLAATILAENPLLFVANENTIFTTSYIAKYLIHPDLYAQQIFYLPVNNNTLVSKLYADLRISGYICITAQNNLVEIEKLLAFRDGPLVPLIADPNTQATGGLLANLNNIFNICTERTVSINTTAIGGNTTLYSLGT